MTRSSVQSNQLWESRWWLLATWLPAILVISVAGIQNAIPIRTLTRDSLQSLGAPFYTGILSNLGIIAWCWTLAVCCFSASLLRRLSLDRDGATFLMGAGLFTGLIMLDDFFMFHEQGYRYLFGVNERLVMGIYALLFLGLVARYRQVILETQWVVLALACGFFAASIFVDLGPVHRALTEFIGIGAVSLLEDGFKLMGIATWAAYFTCEAANRLTSCQKAGAPIRV